jgi:hypothetical protein
MGIIMSEATIPAPAAEHRDEFDFNAPYRGIQPIFRGYTHPSMPGTPPMDILTRPQDWAEPARAIIFGQEISA